MSQTMNQKTATKKKKHKKSRLPIVEEPEELSGMERLYEKVKPHLTTIGLVVVAGALGFIAIAFMIRSNFDQNAAQWRELSTASAIALRTGDINGLKAVAETYPDTKAGLWALQMAGDQQLRMGIEQLSFDREAGNQLIEKAKTSFEQIVDSPQTSKTTMLDRRSHFSLAYTYESLGQLKEAKALYEELIALAPDSAFAEPAQRGLERASNEKYAELYTKFVNYEEEVIGDAPGPALPERPVLEFPDALPTGKKPPLEDGAAATESGDFVPAKTPASDPVEAVVEKTGESDSTAEKTGNDAETKPNKDDEGKDDEGKADEGKADEGKDDEGKADEGKADEGNDDEGKGEQGKAEVDK